MKRYLLAVLLAINSMGALAFSAAAENFVFSLEDLAEDQIDRKIQDFIQKEKDPFGVYSFPFGPNHTMKATILDQNLLIAKLLDVIDKEMGLGTEPELEVELKRKHVLIKTLRNSGFKQALSDSIIELLAQVMLKFGCADTIGFEIDDVDVECMLQSLTQLESMGVIYKN